MTQKTTNSIQVPTIDPNYVIDPEVQSTMVAICKSNGLRNILATGPSGCGKTDMARHLAAITKKPYYEAVVGQLVEALDLVGVKGVADGSTFFHESQFVRAIETKNCVICLDEVNRAPSSVLNLLIPLLDHRGSFYVEELNRTVNVGDGVVFFATANIGSEFAGTYRLDEALTNRFSYRYEVNYLEEEPEANMIASRTGISPDDARILAKVATTLRSKAQGWGGSLSRSVSTRQLLQAGYLIAQGVSIKDSLFVTIVPTYDQEGGNNSERVQCTAAIELVVGTA